METGTQVLKLIWTIHLVIIPLCLMGQWTHDQKIYLDSIPSPTSSYHIPIPVFEHSQIRVYQKQKETLLPDTAYQVWGNQIHFPNLDNVDFPLYILILPLDERLSQTHTWIDTNLIKSEYLLKSLPNDLPNQTDYPAWSQLSYSGHFGRGVQIGNTQNATLQSNFDLQIKGNLPNGFAVTGNLSDNSIPIQPEGNSLQLQEFDRVFIQLEKDEMTLVAGDHEITSPNRYFMRYYKKTKGLYAAYDSDSTAQWQNHSSANYSISKGKFQRITLAVEEGNQGPYRLSSEANQLFTIVLAGTEKVYLDGVKLNRGELNDYTIDYNLGEITFTAKTYISNTSRIIIEYEFAEQNYLRSLFTGHTSWEKNDFTFSFDIYSEQDGKSSFQNDLITPENEQLIANAGDQIENLNGSSIVPWNEGFQEGIIFYHLVDSLGYNNVLVYATHGQKQLYTANFSYVGEGLGDYILVEDFSNGNLYQWVAPNADGRSNGSYAPTTKLQAPQIQQLFAFRGEKKWNKEFQIYSEWSLSRLDLNRFSDLEEANDKDWAQLTGFLWNKNLNDERSKKLALSGSYEFKGKNFTPISPYRSIEFQRDWNTPNTELVQNEKMLSLKADYTGPQLNSYYEYQRFAVQEIYVGHLNQLGFNWNSQKFYTNSKARYMSSRSSITQSEFLRPRINLGWKYHPKGRVEVGYEGEHNAVHTIAQDTLIQPSFKFNRWYAKNQWKKHEVEFSHRTDFVLNGEGFLKGFTSDDIKLSSELQYGEDNSIQLTSTFRHLSLHDKEVNHLENQQGWNMLGQLQFFQSFKKWGGRTNGSLSIGNGKEPRRSFQYIKVEPGNGQYKYVDLNQDSIQQLNEFFPAIYQDEKNYIRVNVLQNELISTLNYAANGAINFSFKDISEHGFWSLLDLENSIRIENKQLRLTQIKIFNIPDSALISSQINVLNHLYMNRNGKTIQQQFGHNFRKQKSFLNYGFESFATRQYFTKSTIRLNNVLQTLIEISRRQVDQATDNFQERNFNIKFWSIKNTLKWLLYRKIQLELENEWIKGITAQELEQSQTLKNKLSASYIPNTQWHIRTSFDYSQVRFEYQDLNLSLEQIMLDGLRSGQNFLWEANVQRKLPNGLILSLRYQGRKIGDGTVIHNGTMQANLLF